MPEQLPPVLTYRWEHYDQDVMCAVDDSDDLDDYMAHTESEVEVERDAARQVLQDIFDAIDQRSREYFVEELVLGVELYIKADIYCRLADGVPVEDAVGRSIDVTVVPGDMIEPVIPNRKRVEEHLTEDAD